MSRFPLGLAALAALATGLLACSKSPPHVSLWSLDNRSLCERQYTAPVAIREGIAEDFTIRLANYRIESCSEMRGVGTVGVITMDLSNAAYPRAILFGKAVGPGQVTFTCKDDDDGTQSFSLAVNVVAQGASFPTTDRCKEEAEIGADGGTDAATPDAAKTDTGDGGADSGN